MTRETPDNSGQHFYGDMTKVVSGNGAAEDRNVNNICAQTGEEFSTEFLRDRIALRRVADQNQLTQVVSNYNQKHQVFYEDLSSIHESHRKGSEYNALDFVPRTGYAVEVESRQFWKVLSGKMKFLCSFGGRILPRPSDGKLRYVGGETRIISIRKNVTWDELAKKTFAICNQSHTIKYQLPGEDLDALISVCSNEDLHHMIEEYQEIEWNGGSQRLRIFLISSSESDSPNSFEGRTPQQSDCDYQYVFAVNGMPDQESSSGQGLASQPIHLRNASDLVLLFIKTLLLPFLH
ncbi:hypothetical protein GH714_006092 [Hevea brasiliensis]|uniref:PB1 domain-containing protein n=1 Tax=Hevea brasiliensis TaxID=3981 RepID=A0A6A6KBZ1_HEVBR|nr:hypothetical protein GH714_006092 [Hevea brasiliensis]